MSVKAAVFTVCSQSCNFRTLNEAYLGATSGVVAPGSTIRICGNQVFDGVAVSI